MLNKIYPVVKPVSIYDLQIRLGGVLNFVKRNNKNPSLAQFMSHKVHLG